MKKIHSRNSGRESEASILGNDWEREFPLTPALHTKTNHHILQEYRNILDRDTIVGIQTKKYGIAGVEEI